MLTLEEQERRAYISGDMRTAEVLAHAIDGDDELSADRQLFEKQRDSVQEELDAANERIAELEYLLRMT